MIWNSHMGLPVCLEVYVKPYDFQSTIDESLQHNALLNPNTFIVELFIENRFEPSHLVTSS